MLVNFLIIWAELSKPIWFFFSLYFLNRVANVFLNLNLSHCAFFFFSFSSFMIILSSFEEQSSLSRFIVVFMKPWSLLIMVRFFLCPNLSVMPITVLNAQHVTLWSCNLVKSLVKSFEFACLELITRSEIRWLEFFVFCWWWVFLFCSFSLPVRSSFFWRWCSHSPLFLTPYELDVFLLGRGRFSSSLCHWLSHWLCFSVPL